MKKYPADLIREKGITIQHRASLPPVPVYLVTLDLPENSFEVWATALCTVCKDISSALVYFHSNIISLKRNQVLVHKTCSCPGNEIVIRAYALQD
jgi:hypothetical protein